MTMFEEISGDKSLEFLQQFHPVKFKVLNR